MSWSFQLFVFLLVLFFGVPSGYSKIFSAPIPQSDAVKKTNSKQPPHLHQPPEEQTTLLGENPIPPPTVHVHQSLNMNSLLLPLTILLFFLFTSTTPSKASPHISPTLLFSAHDTKGSSNEIEPIAALPFFLFGHTSTMNTIATVRLLASNSTRPTTFI